MAPFSIVDAFHAALKEDDELPAPIAAIFALSEMISRSKAETTSELMQSIKQASDMLKASLENPIPASAGLELYMRFVTRKNWAGGTFETHKQNLVSTALEFAHNTVPNCRLRITELLLPFIKNETVILTHGYSRVVMQVLVAAKALGRRICVYVTESRPSCRGLLTYQRLMEAGIPCTVVLDTAVAYIIHKVDMILTGAEGVVESGGLFNAVGTSQLGIVAKAANKMFFAVAESYKFLRLFPLSQYDIPIPGPMLPFPSSTEVDQGILQQGDKEMHMTLAMEALNPSIDYTQPELVTFIVSDIGILTPSGVSDALLAVYGGD
ncbi:translation initiation factor eIF-2B subunit alpha [Malassezia vespertilionis]|uniref:Translation initiation factor eIF2B subunit alpha n=1 Tax=Malassezia vespertilionis TaxID=2020962 RepID=A0A2N1JFR5_9BASI|nr:translation initiation factor eIF-2B subunit alpha [Malassezia vespertilionis]PKI85387.1 Gcn3p [Malassezia vespertilionis]WFD04997.1 translation initiation factor eIF-2B subunit alpha [Malassezia vespertilionis]